jgi:hypothetical protein
MWEIEIKPKKNIPRISDANIIKNLKKKKKKKPRIQRTNKFGDFN